MKNYHEIGKIEATNFGLSCDVSKWVIFSRSDHFVPVRDVNVRQ